MSEVERILDLRHLRPSAPERGTIWWGMVLFLLIEGTVVTSLLTSYFYFRVLAEAGWPPPGLPPPDPLRAAVPFAVLLTSVLPVWAARRAYRDRRRRTFFLGMGVGCVLLAGYLIVSLLDLVALPHRWHEHAYASLVWTIGGYQWLHGIILLLLALGVLLVGARRADAQAWPGREAMAVLVLYWLFVLVVSIPVYVTLYAVPHLVDGRWELELPPPAGESSLAGGAAPRGFPSSGFVLACVERDGQRP